MSSAIAFEVARQLLILGIAKARQAGKTEAEIDAIFQEEKTKGLARDPDELPDVPD